MLGIFYIIMMIIIMKVVMISMLAGPLRLDQWMRYLTPTAVIVSVIVLGASIKALVVRWLDARGITIGLTESGERAKQALAWRSAVLDGLPRRPRLLAS